MIDYAGFCLGDVQISLFIGLDGAETHSRSLGELCLGQAGSFSQGFQPGWHRFPYPIHPFPGCLYEFVRIGLVEGGVLTEDSADVHSSVLDILEPHSCLPWQETQNPASPVFGSERYFIGVCFGALTYFITEDHPDEFCTG